MCGATVCARVCWCVTVCEYQSWRPTPGAGHNAERACLTPPTRRLALPLTCNQYVCVFVRLSQVGSEELLQYQLLFKHMWGLKRVERQLEATWLLLQGTKRLPRPRECSAAGREGGRAGGAVHSKPKAIRNPQPSCAMGWRYTEPIVRLPVCRQLDVRYASVCVRSCVCAQAARCLRLRSGATSSWRWRTRCASSSTLLCRSC